MDQFFIVKNLSTLMCRECPSVVSVISTMERTHTDCESNILQQTIMIYMIETRTQQTHTRTRKHVHLGSGSIRPACSG